MAVKPEEYRRMSETWRRVVVCAIDVAIAAPVTRHKYTHSANVPWRRIEALRTALDQAGVDWKKVKEKAEAQS